MFKFTPEDKVIGPFTVRVAVELLDPMV